MIRRFRPETYLLFAILLLAGAYRFALLNVPFGRNSEGCGAYFGLLARNYFRYDFATTYGIPVMSMGQGQAPIYYANHPPTTSMVIALLYAITGYRGEYEPLPPDWQVRLPTALFTLGCIALIYLLVNRRAGPRPALIAAALFASIPMTLIFGGLADVISTQLVFFALLTVAAYERFHEAQNWRTLLVLIAAFIPAAITDWPAYFLLPVFAIQFMRTRNIRQWKWIVPFCAAGLVIFAAMYAYLTIGQPDWRWMLEQLEHRAMRTEGDTFVSYTFKQWLDRALWNYAIGRHTLIVFVLGLLWLPLARLRKTQRPIDYFTRLLLAWGLLHVLIGRQGVYQHEWWWWPLTPGLVVASGLLLDELLSFLQRRFHLSQTICNIAVAIALMIFAGRNLALVHAPVDPGMFDYSLAEIGEAVRNNTPPSSVAVLAESDMSLAFWYYADRAMKRQVWDPENFERRLTDRTVDLSFDALRPWDARATVMIIPRAYLSKIDRRFVDYLDAHYPRRDATKFLIYDLIPLSAP